MQTQKDEVKAQETDPLTIEDIAYAAHQQNKALCEMRGDTTQPHWLNAPSWQKETILAGVKFISENPSAKPEDSHNSWMAKKKADGWVYGPIKDVDAKVHPCMVPYCDLPYADRAKDVAFYCMVVNLLPFLGKDKGNDPLWYTLYPKTLEDYVAEAPPIAEE